MPEVSAEANNFVELWSVQKSNVRLGGWGWAEGGAGAGGWGGVGGGWGGGGGGVSDLLL